MKRRDWILSFVFILLLAAAPWLAARGREAQLAWPWWRESDPNHAHYEPLLERGSIWPFRMARNSSNPVQRVKALFAFESAVKRKLISQEEWDAMILTGLRDDGVVDYKSDQRMWGGLGSFRVCRSGERVGEWVAVGLIYWRWRKSYLPDVDDAPLIQRHSKELIGALLDPGVPKDARKALAREFPRYYDSDQKNPQWLRLREEIAEAFRKAYQDPDEEIRVACAFARIDAASGNFCGYEDLPICAAIVLKAATQPDSKNREEARQALDLLLRYTNYGSASERAAWKAAGGTLQ